MAASDVHAFFDRVKADPKLRTQLQALRTLDRESAVARMLAIAKAAGYEFTVQEHDAALAAQPDTRALSDTELDQVAGGGGGGTTTSWGPGNC